MSCVVLNPKVRRLHPSPYGFRRQGEGTGVGLGGTTGRDFVLGPGGRRSVVLREEVTVN